MGAVACLAPMECPYPGILIAEGNGSQTDGILILDKDHDCVVVVGTCD